MKILLISYYWSPYNSSGAFRWIYLSEYIGIHTVLTAKKSYKGFNDPTMVKGKVNVIIRLLKVPPILWGIILTPFILTLSFFYDKVIVTVPPESLLFPAWVCQLFKRDIYVDLRDEINRPSQTHKKLVPIYEWLFKRIKNTCVTMEYFDETREFIPHGYIDLKKIASSKATIKVGTRSNYREFIESMSMGIGVDFSDDKKFEHFTSSIIPTLRYLKNPIKGRKNLHCDLFKGNPKSWNEVSKQMEKFLMLEN